MPDQMQIQADMLKLQNCNTLLEQKKVDQRMLRRQNDDLRSQIAQIEASIKHYRKKIKEMATKVNNGRKYIEVPCNHAEEMNQLEVLLASKKNELTNHKKELTVL